MNWYKAATKTAVTVTPAEFGAMGLLQKRALAGNESITPETQRLFFTEPYKMKGDALLYLARNPSVTPEVQRLFFTAPYPTTSYLDIEHTGKFHILLKLAENRSITPETQLLFFTEWYGNSDFQNKSWRHGSQHKGWILQRLAGNRSITPEVQRLFFAKKYKYEGKGEALQYLAGNRSITPETQRLFFMFDNVSYWNKKEILENLAENPSFLHDFTLEHWLLVKGAARGRAKLQVLSKRLKQIVGVS